MALVLAIAWHAGITWFDPFQVHYYLPAIRHLDCLREISSRESLTPGASRGPEFYRA